MQDEIVKHSRKIFSALKKPNQTSMNKVKEIIVEILIIVFAVSFSIWLHGINEHRKEQKEVRVFLKNVREDLNKDLVWLKAERSAYMEKNEKLKKFLNLKPSQIDSLKRNNSNVSFPMQILIDKVNCGNYEGFKSSGKIGYIENEELKKAILNYYQQDAPNAIETNDLYNQYMYKTFDVLIENADKTDYEVIFNPQFQLRLSVLLMFGENTVKEYDKNSIKHASELIKMIDNELKE
jgi:hypothetical protein